MTKSRKIFDTISFYVVRFLSAYLLRKPNLLILFAAFVLGGAIIIPKYFFRSEQKIPGEDLLINLLAGLLTSLIIYFIIKFNAFYEEKYSLNQWLNLGPGEVFIIPPYVNKEHNQNKEYYVVPTFDAKAAGLMEEFVRLSGVNHPRRKVIGSHIDAEFHKENVLKNNLVLLCMPENNAISNIFSKLLYHKYIEGKITDDNIDFENYKSIKPNLMKHFGIEKLGNTWHIVNYAAKTKETRLLSSDAKLDAALKRGINTHDSYFDYALIVKAPNPFQSASTILLIYGIRGIGTYCAARFLYRRRNELSIVYGNKSRCFIVRAEFYIPLGYKSYVDAEYRDINLVATYPIDERTLFNIDTKELASIHGKPKKQPPKTLASTCRN